MELLKENVITNLKSENSRQPKCTREKEEMIVDALKYFKILYFFILDFMAMMQ